MFRSGAATGQCTYRPLSELLFVFCFLITYYWCSFFFLLAFRAHDNHRASKLLSQSITRISKISPYFWSGFCCKNRCFLTASFLQMASKLFMLPMLLRAILARWIPHLQYVSSIAHSHRNTQVHLEHWPACTPRMAKKAQTARHSAQAGDTTKPKAAPTCLCPSGLPEGKGRRSQIPPKWHHPCRITVHQTSVKS